MLMRTGLYRDDAIDSVQKEMLYLVHMREGSIDLVRLLLDAIRSATDGSPEREFWPPPHETWICFLGRTAKSDQILTSSNSAVLSTYLSVAAVHTATTSSG